MGIVHNQSKGIERTPLALFPTIVTLLPLDVANFSFVDSSAVPRLSPTLLHPLSACHSLSVLHIAPATSPSDPREAIDIDMLTSDEWAGDAQVLEDKTYTGTQLSYLC